MGAKLYVGNLSWEVKDDDLRELFAKFGELVEVKVMIDNYSGRSKGFAFVTFVDEESAKKAIAELDGKDFKGRVIKVNEAKPMEERPRRDFGSGGGSGSGGFRRRYWLIYFLYFLFFLLFFILLGSMSFIAVEDINV